MLLIPTLLCPKPWEGMSGNETQRFCSHCKKHVHNLDALSVSERLALLSSPAASICSRYQVAIRRPAKGKEESYYLHLAKHGAGVALVGSVLVVLWEMHGQTKKERFYRAAASVPIRLSSPGCHMPRNYYVEQRGLIKGDVYIPSNPLPPDRTVHEIPDLKIDPKILHEAFEELPSASPSVPPQPWPHK
jgi:hypothetical protein